MKIRNFTASWARILAVFILTFRSQLVGLLNPDIWDWFIHFILE